MTIVLILRTKIKKKKTTNKHNAIAMEPVFIIVMNEIRRQQRNEMHWTSLRNEYQHYQLIMSNFRNGIFVFRSKKRTSECPQSSSFPSWDHLKYWLTAKVLMIVRIDSTMCVFFFRLVGIITSLLSIESPRDNFKWSHSTCNTQIESNSILNF